MIDLQAIAISVLFPNWSVPISFWVSLGVIYNHSKEKRNELYFVLHEDIPLKLTFLLALPFYGFHLIITHITYNALEDFLLDMASFSIIQNILLQMLTPVITVLCECFICVIATRILTYLSTDSRFTY